MLAAALLTLCFGLEPSRAEDYVVEISGVEGVPFSGTCLVITANNNVRHPTAGTVPATLAFAGDLISCGIMRRGGSGNLHIVIRSAAGRIVAESAAAQPFGAVVAGGR